MDAKYSIDDFAGHYKKEQGTIPGRVIRNFRLEVTEPRIYTDLARFRDTKGNPIYANHDFLGMQKRRPKIFPTPSYFTIDQLISFIFDNRQTDNIAALALSLKKTYEKPGSVAAMVLAYIGWKSIILHEHYLTRMAASRPEKTKRGRRQNDAPYAETFNLAASFGNPH